MKNTQKSGRADSSERKISVTTAQGEYSYLSCPPKRELLSSV